MGNQWIYLLQAWIGKINVSFVLRNGETCGRLRARSAPLHYVSGAQSSRDRHEQVVPRIRLLRVVASVSLIPSAPRQNHHSSAGNLGQDPKGDNENKTFPTRISCLPHLIRLINYARFLAPSKIDHILKYKLISY